MTCTGCEFQGWPSYWGDYVRDRVHVCSSCSRRRGDRCGVIVDAGKPGLILHPLGTPNPGSACPLGRFISQPINAADVVPQPKTQAKIHKTQPIDVGRMMSADCERDDVTLVTIHYNPCHYRRLRETYFEWLPTLGPLAASLRTYELVFDDDAPEIPGSIVIRGTREKNLMWQKEPLINIALAETTPQVKYVAWIDHDLVFENLDWLNQAVAKLEAGAVAVQLFETITRLGINRTIQSKRYSSVSQLKQTGKAIGCPGGAWIANRQVLDAIGGLNVENIFGGGDQTFLDTLIGTPGRHLAEYSQPLASSLRSWITFANCHTQGRLIDYVPGNVFHLWHGDMTSRQYTTRHRLLIDTDFDPATDIHIADCGLLEWSSKKPRLHRGLANYFARRREDG